MELNNEESLSYVGGAKITAAVVTVISALGAFILGIYDGYKNSNVCKSR